jgi:hypothetical protein
LDELQAQEEIVTKKQPAPKGMTMDAFLKLSGPGETLEVLKDRQKIDAVWAERAFAGKEPLAPPIRLRRGRPKAGEEAPLTIVKAIRLPVQLLETLQAKAKAQGISLNAILQLAASEYLTHHDAKP